MNRITVFALTVVSLLVIAAIPVGIWAGGTNFDRLILGSGNYGSDPNTSADVTFQNDEYIDNSTDGTLDFGSANLVTTGSVSGAAVSGSSNLTMDDGSGDSPYVRWIDGGDAYGQILKTNNSFLTCTVSAATGGLNITTGNLKVGNGSNGVTLNGEDAYIEGTLEVDAAAQFDGTVATNSTVTAAGNVTLDDGSGASPSLTFKDATDTTAVFAKADDGFCGVTTAATTGLQVLTGNLKVGAGSPGVTLNGSDAYITGTLEVDAAAQFDGAVTTNSTLTAVGNITLDDGSGDTPNIRFVDGSDDTAVFAKVDESFCGLTTAATGGLNIVTGNLKVGSGSPALSLNGDDAYVTGTLEVDGSARFDGNISVCDATTELLTVSSGNLKVGGGSPTLTQDGGDAYVTGTLEADGNVNFGGTLTVGTRTLLLGQYSDNPNSATWFATLSGLDADDYLVATVNKPTNGAYLLSAEPTVDGVTVTLSADPSASVTITFMAWMD